MADTLPSPPTSRASTPTSQAMQIASDDLSIRLDELLEEYLEQLDRYSTLRNELSKGLSNGFLSLANAQRTANIGTGRRYGQEGYDGRMKALRRVKIATECIPETNTRSEVISEDDLTGNNGRNIFDIVQYRPDNVAGIGTNIVEDISSGSRIPGNTNETTREPGADRPVTHDDKPNPAYRDPASWFGLLVPQHLRETQACFIHATEITIPTLVSTASSMYTLEKEIWRVRAALGIEKKYHEKQIIRDDSVSDDSIQEIDQLLAKAKMSSKHN